MCCLFGLLSKLDSITHAKLFSRKTNRKEKNRTMYDINELSTHLVFTNHMAQV